MTDNKEKCVSCHTQCLSCKDVRISMPDDPSNVLSDMKKLAKSLQVKVCDKCKQVKHGSEIDENQSWCLACIEGYRNENMQ